MIHKDKPIKFKKPGSSMEQVYNAVRDGTDSKQMLERTVKLKPNQIAAALLNLATCGMIHRVDTPAGTRYRVGQRPPEAAESVSFAGVSSVFNQVSVAQTVAKNSNCATNTGRPEVERPKPISYRPKSEAAKEKYLRLGGARWLDRVLGA